MSVRKIAKPVAIFVIAVAVIGFLASCNNNDGEEKRELLIYCGSTITKPMSEIAGIIEEQENCKIIIIKGGSGNLLNSIKINGVGDLYLPGCDSYIETAIDEGIVTKTVQVGYNQVAIIVQKGNPKEITSDLEHFTNTDYNIVIGNPESGSIGRETRKVLTARGIYGDVVNNARRLTTDSRELMSVLIDGDADLVINWHSVSTWPENAPFMDTIPIDQKYAKKHLLVLGLLTSSQYPDIARKFMDYAASKDGQALFAKYNFIKTAP